MFRKLLTVAFVCALAASATAQSAKLDKAYLEHILAIWSGGDSSKAAVFYDKSPDNPYYDIAPLKYAGWSEYQQGAQALINTFQSAKLTLAGEPVIHTQGNLGWSAALLKLDTVGKDGKAASMDTRWTAIYQKKGGNWLIVHEHVSAPLPEPPPPAAQP